MGHYPRKTNRRILAEVLMTPDVLNSFNFQHTSPGAYPPPFVRGEFSSTMSNPQL
jgi:hypothetical protein